MPITSTHPLYDANIGRWQRCRDAYNGEDAVKAAGKKYLPPLGDQESAEYEAYKLRALYYEAVGRTIDGAVGSIARKPPQIVAPDAINPLLDNISGDGLGLMEMVKKLGAETLLIARLGIVVDYDEALGRPYLSIYPAESITNWRDDGTIVLLETVYETDPTDPFKQVAIQQYRELGLVDGHYTITVWRKKPDTLTNVPEWAVYETFIPTHRGAPLSEIPFFWLSNFGGAPRIEKPPLLGLVNVSYSHYRTSADLEHGRHFTGLPTLWIAGSSSDSGPIRVGSNTAIQLSDPTARVGFAEFTGQGLGSLENALDSKEHMMTVLGAAIFGHGKAGVESAETARIRISGEVSLLMSVVTAVEEVLEAAVTFAAQWMGVVGDIDIDINRDFVDQKMDPMELQELVGAYVAGTITLETFLYNLQHAEMLPPDTTIKEEIAALAATKALKSDEKVDAQSVKEPVE